MNWDEIRAEFPSLRGRTYLNTATFGQLPRVATMAAAQHFERREREAALDFLTWFEDLDRVRALIGRLIHAGADDIAFVPNAAYALALALNSVKWQPGDELLTLRQEFPNQLYGHASAGASSVECEWGELEAHITARTRMVALSTVNYTTGLRLDLSSIVKTLRERGIVVYLDGTQSAGALEFDCAAIAPDFFAVDAYKWMISPNGAAFVYVHPERRPQLQPNALGWRSDKDWRNVGNLHLGAPRFGDSAEKYEPGMLPFASLYGMEASLKMIEAIGVAAIEARVMGLADLLRRELAGIGASVNEGSQIVAASIPGIDSSHIAKKLAEAGINISARSSYLRISPHFYNNTEDVAVLLAALRKLR